MADNEEILMQLVERAARQEQETASLKESVKELVDAIREFAAMEQRHIRTSAGLDQAQQNVAQLFKLYHEQNTVITALSQRFASSEPMSRLTTRIVFGAAGLILTAVFIAIIAMVMN